MYIFIYMYVFIYIYTHTHIYNLRLHIVQRRESDRKIKDAFAILVAMRT